MKLYVFNFNKFPNNLFIPCIFWLHLTLGFLLLNLVLPPFAVQFFIILIKSHCSANSLIWNLINEHVYICMYMYTYIRMHCFSLTFIKSQNVNVFQSIYIFLNVYVHVWGQSPEDKVTEPST